GTVVPDPLKPTTIYGVGYGAGQGNGMIKIDLATGQWGNVAPNFGVNSSLYVAGRDFWKRFDTVFEPKAMYVGYNCLLSTGDGAQTWKAFSPDLTKPRGERMTPCGVAPASAAAGAAGAAAPAGRGRGGRGANAAAPPTGTPPAAAPPAGTPAAPAATLAALPANARFIADFAISTVKK